MTDRSPGRDAKAPRRPTELRNPIPTSPPRHQADSRSSQTPSPTIVIEPPIHVPAGPRPSDLAPAARSASRLSQLGLRLPPWTHGHPGGRPRAASNLQHRTPLPSAPHADRARPSAAAKKSKILHACRKLSVAVALRDLARRVDAAGTESKFDKLSELLTDPQFAGEKFIIFTEHRDTLSYLALRLRAGRFTACVRPAHSLPAAYLPTDVEPYPTPLRSATLPSPLPLRDSFRQGSVDPAQTDTIATR